MPLTEKGKHILAQMGQTYKDKEKAKQVFYASINAGKIKGAHKKKMPKRKMPKLVKD